MPFAFHFGIDPYHVVHRHADVIFGKYLKLAAVIKIICIENKMSLRCRITPAPAKYGKNNNVIKYIKIVWSDLDKTGKDKQMLCHYQSSH